MRSRLPHSPSVRWHLPTQLLVVTLLALASGCRCRGNELQPGTSALRFDPQVLDLGQPWADGAPHRGTFDLINESNSPLDVSLSGLGTPFRLVGAPTQVVAGSNPLTVEVVSLDAGSWTQTVTASVAGFPPVTATVKVTFRAMPDCTPSDDCHLSHFDPTSSSCVETARDEGAACDPHSVCVLEATCHAGRCVGAAKTCDDHDACTIDVCNAVTGCEFLPAPPCPGDGKCQVGVCDPALGCGLAPADDGTTCGALQTCQAAQVCISGQCVVRDPPEGYRCAEASPCASEGRCVSDVCVRASGPTMLSPRWSKDTLAGADAGVLPYADFVLERSGDATLSNFFNAPSLLRANTPSSTEMPGGSRRCILWNAHLVCADYPNTGGTVSEVDLATGATTWTFDIHAARPDFVAETQAIFLARLVVQGSDRLAALYEAYPLTDPLDAATQCRKYYLIVLDASGQLVMSERVEDPLLAVCKHPHPYGVVADAVGNLFIAFSPTTSPQAPLVPTNPTLIMSYTHDGIFRWKLTDNTMTGGELAVAHGVLYPENSTVALVAATGAANFALPDVLGRVVVSQSRLLPAPVQGQGAINGYEAGVTTLRWTHALPPPTTFWSDQVRLAQWQTSRGQETIALTFTVDAASGLQPSYYLRGLRVNDGSEAFTCPLDVGARTPPQLFEVANGALTLMEGALDSTGAPACAKCDPPFATSAAAFFSYDLPGISVAREPWIGTFGGEGHDHQEEVLITGSTQ